MAVEKLWSENKYKFHNLLLNFTYEMYSVLQEQCTSFLFSVH